MRKPTTNRLVSFTLVAILILFASPYSPLTVGIGQLVLYLWALLVLSFYVRRRLEQRTWRLLHYLTFLTFIGGSYHGLTSGSDSGQPWALWLYVIPIGLVSLLPGYRVFVRLKNPRAAMVAST